MKFFSRNLLKVFILAFILMLNKNLVAQDVPPLITDRPDFTESPFIVPVNFLQIETGFVFQKQIFELPTGKIENDNLMLATTLIRYGISEKLEFRFGGDYFSGKTVSPAGEKIIQGIEGLFIGAKYNLLVDQHFDYGIALLAELALPFGNENLRPEKIEPAVKLAGSKNINSFLDVSANLGFVNQASVSQNLYLISFSLGASLSEKIHIFVEYFGNSSKNFKPQNHFDTGLTYLHRENIQLDFSVGKLLDKKNTDWFGNLGISLRLPK